MTKQPRAALAESVERYLERRSGDQGDIKGGQPSEGRQAGVTDNGAERMPASLLHVAVTGWMRVARVRLHRPGPLRRPRSR